MPRLKLTIAYVGTLYSGWQLQLNKTGKQPVTIQGLLEEQLQRLCGYRIPTLGSGRTDAGVHADCQVVHCDIPENKKDVNWQLALNTSLPTDIRVKSYAYVDDDFNALFDVERKAYTYSLWLDRSYLPPKLYPFTWNCGRLNLEKMDASIPFLLGTHDFTSLQNTGTHLRTTERTIFSIKRSPVSDDPENHEIQIYFEADGFLRQMVRNLTGLMVTCGRGKIAPEDIPRILASKDRTKAPTSAPAKGLCMTNVWYKNKSTSHE